MSFVDPFLIVKFNQKRVKKVDQKLNIKKRKPTEKSWTQEEHKQYLHFFINEGSQFVTQKDRKEKKIYLAMAKYILTRSPPQIKSHHQKISKKWKSNKEIINNMKEYLQNNKDEDMKKNKDSQDRTEGLFLERSQNADSGHHSGVNSQGDVILLVKSIIQGNMENEHESIFDVLDEDSQYRGFWGNFM